MHCIANCEGRIKSCSTLCSLWNKKLTKSRRNSKTTLEERKKNAGKLLKHFTPLFFHLMPVLRSSHVRHLGSDEPVAVLGWHVFEKMFCGCEA